MKTLQETTVASALSLTFDQACANFKANPNSDAWKHLELEMKAYQFFTKSNTQATLADTLYNTVGVGNWSKDLARAFDSLAQKVQK